VEEAVGPEAQAVGRAQAARDDGVRAGARIHAEA
jgi:hypothetical protein